VGDGQVDILWLHTFQGLFEDTGDHEMKGVPDRGRLYRVVSPRLRPGT
jgi:hypothetical protein